MTADRAAGPMSLWRRYIFCGAASNQRGSSQFFRPTKSPGKLHIARANFTDEVDRLPRVHAFLMGHKWNACRWGLIYRNGVVRVGEMVGHARPSLQTFNQGIISGSLFSFSLSAFCSRIGTFTSCTCSHSRPLRFSGARRSTALTNTFFSPSSVLPYSS